VSRLSIVTVGTRDLAVARRFYVEGLGWNPTFEVPGEVCFIQVAHGVLLALWRAEAMAEDAGHPVTPGDNVVLACNVGSADEVEALIARAETAGALVLKPAQEAFFGGVQGYFADPADGVRWEVAWNPGLSIDADGTVQIGPAPD
jgi:catechol 2,3-dioxygenase-like lactoylglutathione lyase family enzyme